MIYFLIIIFNIIDIDVARAVGSESDSHHNFRKRTNDQINTTVNQFNGDQDLNRAVKTTKISGEYEKKGELITYASENIKITYYNTGQGNCVTAETEKNSVKQMAIIDCGNKGGDSGQGKLAIDFIINKIYKDYQGKNSRVIALVSHDHDDHTNGIINIAKEKGITIDSLIVGISNKNMNGIESKASKVNDIEETIRVKTKKELQTKLNELEFNWIKAIYVPETKHTEQNENNIVVEVKSGKCSALLPGDADTSITGEIFNKKTEYKTDIFMVPHHGSNTAIKGGGEWIKYIKPQVSIISAALSNTHGLPTDKLVSHLETIDTFTETSPHSILDHKNKADKEGTTHEIDKAIYSTATNGTMYVTFNNNKFTISSDGILNNNHSKIHEFTQDCHSEW